MEVLLGNDALLYFKNPDGDYIPYVCCETFEVSVSTTTKSVKTIGDGIWGRERLQKIEYSLTSSGVIRIDDPDGTYNNFDLLEYQAQGVGIEWKAVYKANDHSTEYTLLYGTCLITESTFSAPNDFVNGSFSAKGIGELNRGQIPTCTAEIDTYTFVQSGPSYANYKMTVTALVSGTVPRYDWRVDGGPMETSLTSEWNVNVISLPSAGIGDHTLEVWPVCDNGIAGVKTTINYTVSI